MSRLRLILERQWLHGLLLVALLAVLGLARCLRGIDTGILWGISTREWFWIAVAAAIMHQVYVWFCWRTQLHGSWPTLVFGNQSLPLSLGAKGPLADERSEQGH